MHMEGGREGIRGFISPPAQITRELAWSCVVELDLDVYMCVLYLGAGMGI